MDSKNGVCTCNLKQFNNVNCIVCRQGMVVEKPNIECQAECTVHKLTVAICGASYHMCESCKNKGYTVQQTGFFTRTIMLNGAVVDDNTNN